MAKIIRDMNAEEQAFYDSDAKRHPWLKSITMTDDELRTLLDKYLPDIARFYSILYGIGIILGCSWRK